MAEATVGAAGGDFVLPTNDGGTYLKLRVSPGAKRTGARGLYGEEALKLSVAAAPVDGKANAEVERYLARVLGVSRSEVRVVRGMSSRDKLAFVRGLGSVETRTRLEALIVES